MNVPVIIYDIVAIDTKSLFYALNVIISKLLVNENKEHVYLWLLLSSSFLDSKLA